MFGQRLKEVRKSKDKKVTQQQLADILGIDRSSIAKWETDEAMPSVELVTKIATIFDVSIDYLLGFDKNIEEIDINPTVKLPVFSCIPADILLEEIAVEEYIDIPTSSLEEGKDYYCFKVNDSSMLTKYLNSDILIIEKNDEFYNGQDCLLSIYESDAFLRRVIKQDEGLTLQPLNNAYKPIFCDNDSVRIIGLVKGLVRIFR